jgi:hypothetical protein
VARLGRAAADALPLEEAECRQSYKPRPEQGERRRQWGGRRIGFAIFITAVGAIPIIEMVENIIFFPVLMAVAEIAETFATGGVPFSIIVVMVSVAVKMKNRQGRKRGERKIDKRIVVRVFSVKMNRSGLRRSCDEERH